MPGKEMKIENSRSRSRSKSRSRSDLSNKCFLVKLISKNGPKSTSFFSHNLRS